MSANLYVAQLLSTDKAKADELYQLLRRNQHDPAHLYSSPFAIECTPQAWCGEIACTQEFVDVIYGYNSNGYPAPLMKYFGADPNAAPTQTEIDSAKSQIDALRLVVFVDYYRVRHSDGTKTINESALDDFIASKGFSYV